MTLNPIRTNGYSLAIEDPHPELDNRFQTEGRGCNWSGAVVFDFVTSEKIS